MKKGASHVDWAISMGLFIVFIMLTLTFLRPGTEPIYKGDVLQKIIEDKLKEDTYYTVEKQLLHINSNVACTPTPSKPCKIRIEGTSKPIKGLNPDWVSTEEIRKNTTVMNSSNDYSGIKWDIYDEYDTEEGYVLDFSIKETKLENGDNIFYIAHSEDFQYETDGNSAADIYMKDTPTQPGDKCDNCFLNGYDFTYDFGVPETHKGFSKAKLESLKSKDYTTLKNDWKIPGDKEFKVNITSIAYATTYANYKLGEYKPGIEFFKGKEEQIPPQVSVFVKEWKDWVLTPAGELLPIDVHIELW